MYRFFGIAVLLHVKRHSSGRTTSKGEDHLPADSATATHWYKQNVCDPANNQIDEIMDVLVDRDGKISALIVGVGGFLGIDEKDVAATKYNNKWYLVMNSTKDALKSVRA
ncbi:MAG: PRC-barrel domain-containing protein [Isosphaeraceae bacterium]